MQTQSDSSRNVNDASAGASRRNFLGTMGGAGIAALGGMFVPPSANAATPGPRPDHLNSIQNVNVNRNESFDVAGGKEHFIEWQANDDKGTVQKFNVHHLRVDSGVTYTMNTNVVVSTYAAGASLQGKPTSVKEQNVSVYGIKGEITGSVRNDHVTITTVRQDGTTSRQSMTAAVRLDNSEFANMNLSDAIASIGSRFIGQSK